MSDLTPGDPLSGGDEEPRRPRPAAPAPAPAVPAWPPPEVPDRPLTPPETSTGYASPPPPGAGGIAAHTFASPRPGSGGLVLASYGSRAGAAIIDALIVGVVALAIMAPLGIGVFASSDSDGFFAFVGAFLVVALVVTVVAFLYAPLFMARTNGQTLGRMATGIRVIRTSGEPMSFGWAFLREVVVKGFLINGILGSLTFGLATVLDLLWPLWDEENRALHDFVVQTRSVKA